MFTRHRPPSHTRLSHGFPVALLVALAAAGCTAAPEVPQNDLSARGDSVDAPPPGAADVTIEEACALDERVAAEHSARCGETLYEYRWGVAREASCKGFFALPGVGTTPTDYVACLNLQRALPCDASLRCDLPKGTLERGAGCVSDRQCKTGHCTAPYHGCGVCDLPTAIGERCAHADECDDDSFCDEGRCAPRKSEGAACGEESDACAHGLSCSGGTCVRPGGVGEACADQWGCRSYACVRGRCASLGKAGDACGSGDKDCAHGHECKEGICVATRARQPGERCSDEDGCMFSPCTDTADGKRCARFLESGEACDPNHRERGVCRPYARCIKGRCESRYSRVCPDAPQ
jgi:hypothetical protein